ncbi:hypothetical protein CMT52_21100 [Elizabethkingia anophelis]|nr:hypothetical protein [Elizabethkingia anophelis]
MNFILPFIAIILFVILEPFSFVYVVFWKKRFMFSRISGYFRQFAVDIDRFGNHHFRSFFNANLIQVTGYKFGDFRETISSVLGKNQRDKTLTKTGKILVSILDFIDKEHCKKSIVEL